MFIEKIDEMVSQYVEKNNENDLVYVRHNIATMVYTLHDERIINWKAAQQLRRNYKTIFS